MKIQYLALNIAMAATACTLQAQQSMPYMPGMKMDPQPPKPQQSPAPKPNRTKAVPDPIPGDMKSMSQDAGNARAKAAADSVTQSFQQQVNQPQANPALRAMQAPPSCQSRSCRNLKRSTSVPAVTCPPRNC